MYIFLLCQAVYDQLLIKHTEKHNKTNDLWLIQLYIKNEQPKKKKKLTKKRRVITYSFSPERPIPQLPYYSKCKPTIVID